MSDIFISYASEDRDRAKVLATSLESQGWSVWWDRTLLPGKEFDEVIEHELDASRCVIVLWSKTSVTSRWVRAEAREGLDKNKLIPVFLGEVKVPRVFRGTQGADLADWSREFDSPAFRQLVDAVADMIGPPPAAEAKHQAEEEAKRKAEKERRRKAEAEAKRKVEEEQLRIEAEARDKAKEETQRLEQERRYPETST